MAFNHGVTTRQVPTSVATPVLCDSGVVFAVGTAPVHTVGGKVQQLEKTGNYPEAAAWLGYSDDWEKYTLCEVMDSHYRQYGVGPVIFVNVLDPAKHRTKVEAVEKDVLDGKVLLPLDGIADTVTVASGNTSYTAGTDFAAFYEDGSLIVEVLEGGGIPANVSKLTVGYMQVDPGKVTIADVVGGFDVSTKKTTGLELFDSIFPKYGIVADIVIAPGFSHNSTVAAVMAAKAETVNGLFEGKAYVDIDSAEVTHYSEVSEWKASHNITSKAQYACWPMVALDSKKYHISTQAASLTAQTDAENGGIPSESPSNLKLQADSTVLADGTEVLLDWRDANSVNSAGVTTAYNHGGKFVLWGNYTACFPHETDVKNYFVNVSRMFAWLSNSIILTYWEKTDRKLNRRLVDSITDGINAWLNGLVADGHLLGGRVVCLEEENSLTSLMAGKIVFHLYITPPSPAQEIEFVLEYDVAAVVDTLLSIAA